MNDFDRRYEDTQIKKALAAFVRRAYNEGFSEGMKEHTSRNGGKSWHDSDMCKKLEAYVGFSV